MFDWEKADDEEIVEKVTNDFNKASSARQQYEEKWLEFYKLYRNYKEDAIPGRSNLFVPYTFSVIETVVPRIISTLFASRPYIGYIPTNSESVDRAKNMESLVDYQLTQKIGFISIAAEWIKEALIYGTGILKVGWQFEEKEVTRREPIKFLGATLGSRPTVTTDIVKDEPLVECIDLFDFYVEPGATSIDNANYCIHKVVRDKAHLKRMEELGVYTNIDELEDESTETGADIRKSELGEAATDKKGITLLEYWTDDRVVVVANETTVIRNEPNPYWCKRKPFIRIVDTIDPHNFWGIGEIEPIKDLQHALNTVRNMRLDNVNLIINRMFTIRRYANIDPQQLVMKPGGFIEVEEHDDIRPIELKNVTTDSYKEDDLIRQDIDITSGVNDYVRGTNPDRRETATTSSVLSQSANERIKLKATLIEDMGLRALGYWLAALNMQFVDRPYTVRLLGDGGIDFTELTSDDINGDFDVIALGSAVDPVVNKSARLHNLIQLYNVFKDNPYVNPVEFTKRILEAADIKGDNLLNLKTETVSNSPREPMNEPRLPSGATGMEDELGRLVNG